MEIITNKHDRKPGDTLMEQARKIRSGSLPMAAIEAEEDIKTFKYKGVDL